MSKSPTRPASKKTPAPKSKKTRPKSTKNWEVLPEGLPVEEILRRAQRKAVKPKAKPKKKPRKSQALIQHAKPRLSDKLKDRVAARTDLSPPEVKQQLGNEERISILSRRAVYLHGFEGRPYRVIATMLADEFKLVTVPSISSICEWLRVGKVEFMKDIVDMRMQIRLQQFDECEDLKRQWFAAANRQILVARTKVIDGQPMEIIDENAFDEQAKALGGYIKLMERQAKLLGLDLSGVEEEKGGKQSPQEIYLYISQMLNQNPIKQAQGQEVRRFGGLELCLDSGKKSEL